MFGEKIKTDKMNCSCEMVKDVGGLLFLEDCKCAIKTKDGWIDVEVDDVEIATPPTL